MEIKTDVKTKITLEVDGYLLSDEDEDAVFDTTEEAKNYFIEHVEITLKNVKMFIDYDDQSGYSDIEEDDDDNIYEWEEWVDDLLHQYEIEPNFNGNKPEGPIYDLEGTPKNLIAFMSEYTDHWDMEDKGDALYEEKKELINWIDSKFPTISRGFFRDEGE